MLVPQNPTIPSGLASLSAEKVIQPGAVTFNSELLLLKQTRSSSPGPKSVQVLMQLPKISLAVQNVKEVWLGNSQLG